MKIQNTADGSHTLFSTKAQQTYHSDEGAIMESRHVYISPAFIHFQDKSIIKILEIGFGTGLNAILTLLEAGLKKKNVCYEAIEPDPVPEIIYKQLNYPDSLSCNKDLFLKLHQAAPDHCVHFPYFQFIKKYTAAADYTSGQCFDVIYFDAFSPDAQPEMWTSSILNKMYQSISPNGILLTYSAKGIVKRTLKDAGFQVKRLPGAGSKHHMLKAEKILPC
ncbi:MAG: tRNA (5-methylaminomethyl-2-thiouridine)(34)-methyltransferase MnmD [Tannerella sp.]|jgi:tRNA U34 5-methylaminomethyl-2-thiouridine-forming methyltransferase MnmC|nr:tRNA (5-methylaminomethyl-2-thiouridine)(34)-methyltransferase MnmD [Tannerella sp.]